MSVVVITQRAADRDYILRLHDRGLSINEVWRRCDKRMLWHSPRPTVKEIERIIREREGAGDAYGEEGGVRHVQGVLPKRGGGAVS